MMASRCFEPDSLEACSGGCHSGLRDGCRAPVGRQMLQMLLDGEIHAAIFGGEIPDRRLKTVIPDADMAALPLTI